MYISLFFLLISLICVQGFFLESPLYMLVETLVFSRTIELYYYYLRFYFFLCIFPLLGLIVTPQTMEAALYRVISRALLTWLTGRVGVHPGNCRLTASPYRQVRADDGT